MVIVDQRQKTNSIDFGCLDFGDVFQDEDGDICMRTTTDYGAANAVVLTTGATFRCDSDTPVTLLNAELVVKGESQ